jgi:immunity protein 26 of polymorphic toxin system
VVPLGDDTYGYGLVLKDPLFAFFDFRSTMPPPPVEEVVRKPVAFRVCVMRYVITKGLWPVIGHVDVPAQLLAEPEFFKQDPMTGALSITKDGGDERPATLEECRRLECAAVWEAVHVADRLRDHFAGRPNKWYESTRPR